MKWRVLTVLVASVLLAGALAGFAGEAPVGKDGAPMVVIPEGEFLMGTDKGRSNERPEHKVWLPAYAIDLVEATMGRYTRFLEAKGHEAPPLWDFEAAEKVPERAAVGLAWPGVVPGAVAEALGLTDVRVLAVGGDTLVRGVREG